MNALTERPENVPYATVGVLVDAVNDLPVSSTTYEPGGLVGRTIYKWMLDTEANQALPDVPIPAGCPQLPVPPAGAPGSNG